MSRNSPVVWSEGMLLAPQHLQQFDRYVQRLIAERFRAAHGFDTGFTALDLDAQALRNGRLELRAARGVFPDGTPFATPEEDPLPPARSIEGHFKIKTIHKDRQITTGPFAFILTSYALDFCISRS